MDKQDKSALDMLSLLTCKDSIDEFLKALCEYYKADSAHIFETYKDVVTEHVYNNGTNTDNQDIYPLISSGSFRETRANKMLIGKLYHGEIQIGFIVVKNYTYSDNEYMIKTLNPFVAYYIHTRNKIQTLLSEVGIDTLTNLYNKNEYMRKLGSMIAYKPSTLGVIFIDINSLKELNDTHGHEYGDKVIKDAAAIIKHHTGSKSYRFGGDEFIVLLDNIRKDEFEHIVKAVNDTFLSVDDYSVSIGYSYRDKGVDIEQQIEQADSIMYRQKEQYYRSIKHDRRSRHRDSHRFWSV